MIVVEDIEPGIKRIGLNIEKLYPDIESRLRFKKHLQEFLIIDTTSEIVEYKNGLLSYLTESVIPTNQDSRPPLLLLFGNPAPESIQLRCFFASEKGKREHRFWPIMEKAGIISFSNAVGDINTFRTASLFNLNYNSPFRIGLAVFYSLPSPASDKKWSGVAGLKRLFGARAFQDITFCEKKRVENTIQEFIGGDPRGYVIAFQKDAYFAVRDEMNQGKIVAKEGKWCIFETRCLHSGIRLFRMAPTRYMNARWYVEFLQIIRKLYFR